MRSGTSQKENKKYWCKAKWIFRATGWTRAELHAARKDKMITWTKTSTDGFQYDLYSIPPHFLLMNQIKRENEPSN